MRGRQPEQAEGVDVAETDVAIENEIERIREEYRLREADSREATVRSNLNEAHYFITVQRERKVVQALKEVFGRAAIPELRFLDVGCGTGAWVQRLVALGARPENLYGIDLMEERIAIARENSSPRIHFTTGSADRLPYPDEFFDVVFQFMMFTSILDAGLKQRIGQEMVRVLKPGGRIFWYDYPPYLPGRILRMVGCRKGGEFYHVAPIPAREVRELFMGCSLVRKQKLTLHFKLAALAKHMWLLCCLLEKMKTTSLKHFSCSPFRSAVTNLSQ